MSKYAFELCLFHIIVYLNFDKGQTRHTTSFRMHLLWYYFGVFLKIGRTPKINKEKLWCEWRSTHLAKSRKESLNSYEIWIISFDCSLLCSSLMETINTIFRQKKLLISVFTDLIEYILNNLSCLPFQLWNYNTTIILQYVILPLWHYSRMSLSCSERSMWHYEIQNRRISQK